MLDLTTEIDLYPFVVHVLEKSPSVFKKPTRSPSQVALSLGRIAS
jgi:hypothetical protein